MADDRTTINRLVIKIINACQHNCFYCVNNDSAESSGKMSLKTVEDIIKKFLPEEIEFSGGEVALDYKRILGAVKIANKQCKIIMLNTNMELWNKKKFIELERNGLTHIHLAINTLDKELHKKIRGNKISKLNAVIQNLGLLLRHTNIKVQFEFVMMKINLHEFKRVYLYINSLRNIYGARIECFEAQRLILNGRAKISMRPSENEEIDMFKKNAVLDCPIIIFCRGENTCELSKFKYKIHKCSVGVNSFYIDTMGRMLADNYNGHVITNNYKNFNFSKWLLNNNFICPLVNK